MKKFIVPILYCLFLNSLAQPSLKEIMSYSFPTNLVGSKTEGKITWVENKEGVRNIFMAASPDYLPVQVTQYVEDDGQELSNLVFTDDHLSILYVRGGAPNRRGEYPNPTSNPDGFKREIHLVEIETGFPRLIAEGTSPVIMDSAIIFLSSGAAWITNFLGEDPERLFQVRGGVSSLRLSPDKTKLAFVNGRGDHAFIGIFDFTDGSLSFPEPTIDIDTDPVWSPDGSKLAFLRTPNETHFIFHPRRTALPYSIQIIEIGKSGSTQLWQADEGKGSAFRTISASNQIFWTKSNNLIFPWEKDGWTHLYSISASGGDTRLLTPGKSEVQFVTLGTDGNTILYSGNEGDTDRQHAWTVTGDGDAKQLIAGNEIEWAPVLDGEGNIATLSSGGTKPGFVARLSSGKKTDISADTDYPSSSLVEPEQVIFTAADGMKINAQLFLPKGIKKGEKKPAVIFFHGGSRRQMLLGFHHRGYYTHAYALNQYLASKGYVVLSVNYRSGIGYGMEFREAINFGADGASEFNDVLGAGIFLQNHENVDPERIGLWGGSYGGYLTALGLARASDLFKAGVDIHGVYDWNPIITNFIPSYDPLEHPAFARRAKDSSPISFMDTWKSPVLLIHGDDDRNVPFSETVNKAEELRRQDVEFEQLIFPDEVHGFLLHKNWLKAYETAADFFDRKL